MQNKNSPLKFKMAEFLKGVGWLIFEFKLPVNPQIEPENNCTVANFLFFFIPKVTGSYVITIVTILLCYTVKHFSIKRSFWFIIFKKSNFFFLHFTKRQKAFFMVQASLIDNFAFKNSNINIEGLFWKRKDYFTWKKFETQKNNFINKFYI